MRFGRVLAGDRFSVRNGGRNGGWHARPYGRLLQWHNWRRIRRARPRTSPCGATRASADDCRMSHEIRHHVIHVHLHLTGNDRRSRFHPRLHHRTSRTREAFVVPTKTSIRSCRSKKWVVRRFMSEHCTRDEGRHDRWFGA